MRRMSSCALRAITRFTYGSSTLLKKKAPLGRHAGSRTLELTTISRFTPCAAMPATMFPAAAE
jgi:hypothetical protein